MPTESLDTDEKQQYNVESSAYIWSHNLEIDKNKSLKPRDRDLASSDTTPKRQISAEDIHARSG